MEHKTFTQPPKPEGLVNYLQRHFPEAHYHCACEAGYCGFWIHDELEALGVDCIVVNPADVPTIQIERTFKTDRIDTRKLARALRNGELTPICVPLPQEPGTKNWSRRFILWLDQLAMLSPRARKQSRH